MAAISAFFSSLHKTLVAGVVLLIVLIVLVGLLTGQFIKLDNPWWLFFWRWLHIMAGIMWMGLVWYGDFVQPPAGRKIEPAEDCGAIAKFIGPNVLFSRRFAAIRSFVSRLIPPSHKEDPLNAPPPHNPG